MLLLLAACQPHDPKESVPEETGYAIHDTAPVIETGDDTAPIIDTSNDSAVETGESGDTAPIDTGGDAWLALDVYPAAMVVHPGATWALRVVATDPDGVRGDLDGAAFTSDDAAVATVDATGTVTAVAAGTTALHIAYAGLESTSTVEVRADGVATITVLDGSTGLPLDGARVALPFTSPVTTDASGVALLPVTDGGPITFSAWANDNYDALTVVNVVGRQFTVSILPKDTDPRSATLTGSLDFAGVDDAGWSDVVVGFAAASIQGALASFRLDDLFAENRTISVFGVDADAPANLFVEGSADDYAATAAPGAVGVWGLAGPLAISDVTSGLSGAGDALNLVADNLGAMSWGQVTGLSAAADTETSANLAPSDRFDAITPVSLPATPIGFHGDEAFFVLVAEERATEGWFVTGLGAGNGAVDVPSLPLGTVADSLGTSVLAYGQVGGIGSGGATSAAVGTEGPDGTYTFPELQDVAVVSSWDAASRALGATVDADADFVRIRLRDDVNRVHDVLAPSSWSGTLPNCVNGFRLAHATVEVLSLQTADGSFEGWMAEGDLDPDTKNTLAAARTIQEN